MSIDSNNKEFLKRIWSKGQDVAGYNNELIRKDACGAWIIWEEFDNTDSKFGWQIDHIYPKNKLEETGVDATLIDEECNLRPFNCANIRSKADDYPAYKAAVTSDGEKNVDTSDIYMVNEKVRERLDILYKLSE